MDDLALDAEILKHAFKHSCILFKRFGRQRCVLDHILGFVEQMHGWQGEAMLIKHGALGIAVHPVTRLRTGGRR
jgi:hypothetical protein